MSSTVVKRVLRSTTRDTEGSNAKKARTNGANGANGTNGTHTMIAPKNTQKNAKTKQRKNNRKNKRKTKKEEKKEEEEKSNACVQDAQDICDVHDIDCAIFTQDFFPTPTLLTNAYHIKETGIRMVSKWTDAEKALPLMNVVVCMRSGSSYDPLYEQVPPNVPNGRTAVYIISYSVISHLHLMMMGVEPFAEKDIENDLQKLCTDINSVNKEDVVFYWECCSHCTTNFAQAQFGIGRSVCSIGKDSMVFISYLLKDRKIMVMCSDFSLGGLVNDWDIDLLGPNPFVLLGETNVPIKLKFKQQTLLDSNSVQLENVGKLSVDGTATVGVMPGTVVYSVKEDTESMNVPYTVNVLTVSEGDSFYSDEFCTTSDGEHTGTAGQVMLSYTDGGTLLVSNGHFIELQKLDTNIARLLQVATQEYGKAYSDGLAENYRSLSQTDQKALLKRETSRYVSGAVPCQRSQSQAV